MCQVVPYLEEAVLLRAVARALALPLPVAATALAFLHGARRSGHAVALPPAELVCGCLYAAAKAEEAQLSTNQAINAARLLALPANRALLHALCPLARLLPRAELSADSGSQQKAGQAQQQPGEQRQQQAQHELLPPQQAAKPPLVAPPPADCAGSVLVGDAYYCAKDALFTAEQHVLRLNRFRVDVAHPYKHLAHMAHALLGAGAGEGASGGGGEHGREAAGGEDRRSVDRRGSGSGEDAGSCSGLSMQQAAAAARAGMALLHDVLTVTVLGVTEAPGALAAAALVAALMVGGSDIRGGGGDGQQAEEQANSAAVGAADSLVVAAGLDPGRIGSLAQAMLQLATVLARGEPLA